MATTPNSTTFYVYALARPVKKDWKIFYIGKGTKRRVFAHEKEAKSGHNCHKCNVLRKVWREGGKIQRYILFTTNDEQEAFAYEKEMIALHGRENLCNLTDGGEGVSGAKLNHSQESNESRRHTMKRIRGNPSYEANFSNAMRAHWQDSEYHTRVREKINQALRRPENRASTSQRMKAMWADPEFREKAKERATPEYRARASAKQKENWSDPDYRERLRNKTVANWQNPEYRQKVTESIRASRLTPEYKAKISAATKAYQGTPEMRAVRSAQMKVRWADPEWRAKTLAARKAARKQKL